MLCASSAIAAEQVDLYDLPIESLLNIQVTSASKFPQKESDAPTAVTVITAQDIKDYGYRTVSEIVRSVRGVYINSDRNYDYIGNRGFNVPGDLNTGVLVLLDGYRLNDALYDQGPISSEFPVDIDLIERVEFLPGAGSAIYGNNAFFGVINIITKTGKDFKGHGVEVSGRVASYGTDQERISFGKRFENGANLIVSASRHDSEGEKALYFPELDSPETNNGVTSYGNFDKAERLFAKLSWQHLTLETGYSKRKKGLTTGIYGTEFNDPRSQNNDQHFFVNLAYDNQISDHLNLYARAYHGRYDYPGVFVYVPETVNYTEGLSRWWGSEFRLMSTHLDKHKLVLGGEFQHNYHLSIQSVDIDPPASLGFDKATYRYGFFLQDEMQLFDNLIFNTGVRLDHFSYAGTQINPRLALIYKPWENTAFKFIYGSSFRAPSPYELYYSNPSQLASPNLSPEKIKTFEGIIEYQPDSTLKLTAVGFHYQTTNLVELREIPASNPNEDPRNQYVNSGKDEAWGAEFEVEKIWAYGSRLRASYTWVDAFDSDDKLKLINSPSHLLKLNFSTPLFDNKLRAGIETQYTSRRQGRNRAPASGYPLVNLTLTTGNNLFDGYLKGLEISGSIYNLTDQPYESVTSDEFVQYFIPHNGRNLRLVMSYRF